jgi:hypothetical protein
LCRHTGNPKQAAKEPITKELACRPLGNGRPFRLRQEGTP